MARKDKLDQQLRWVAALEADEIGTAERDRLLEMIDNGHPRLVSRALAKLGEKPEAVAEDLIADLFERHRRGSADTDPGCEIKAACIRLLGNMESGLVDTFLAATAYRQKEPAYGGPIDTAADLRAQAFAALVALGYRELHYSAVDLLHDDEPETRRLTIAAMAEIGSEGAELLLRAKLASGDPEPAVTAECFSSLMRLNADKTMPLAVASMNDADPVVAEAAALAIGESRHPEAFTHLRTHWEENPSPRDRDKLVLPIALTRHAAARDFLLEALASGERRLERSLLSALSIYRGDDALRARLEAVIEDKRNPRLEALFRETFGG